MTEVANRGIPRFISAPMQSVFFDRDSMAGSIPRHLSAQKSCAPSPRSRPNFNPVTHDF
jgi:hypothetical protein